MHSAEVVRLANVCIHLALQLLVILLSSLGPDPDSLMNLCRPVDLVSTNHHLAGPLPHPLNTRLQHICLQGGGREWNGMETRRGV